MPTDYPPNTRVSVQIISDIPSGLLGFVKDTRAIIRRREIAWEKPLPLHEYFGQERDAIVIGFNPTYQSLELSLRLAEHDPWKDAAERFPLDVVVEGRVTGILEDAVFVEIEPGIEGLLRADELLSEPIERIGDLLWMGDRVRAIITRIDQRKRLLSLSVKKLLAQRDSQFYDELWEHAPRAKPAYAPLAVFLSDEIRHQLRQIGQREGITTHAHLRVLVIEDDEIYGAGLENLLRVNGCEVTRAVTSALGLASIRNQPEPFDLIVVDWGLPDLKGHELIEVLKKERCPSPILMLLEPTPLADHPKVWEQLRNNGADVLSKSDEESEHRILSIIEELRTGKTDRTKQVTVRTHLFPKSLIATPNPPTTFGEALPAQSIKQKKHLDELLARLLRITHSTTALVLRFDPGPCQFYIEGLAGKPFLPEPIPPDFIHSPLADILQKNQEIFQQVELNSSRFKRLLDRTSFSGFLGIPIPSFQSSHYGLILVKEKGNLVHHARDQARTMAYLIGGILQERHLIQALAPWQAQSLMGQLLGGIVHEVTNKLGGIQFQTEFLQEKLKELNASPENAEDAAFLHDLEQAVERTSQAYQEANHLRMRYLGLTSSDKPQLVDLKGLTADIVALLRTDARHNNIILTHELPETLPGVNAQPSQLRQVFVNLTLNAIQQMAQWKRQGKITIKVSYDPDLASPIRIRFKDDGAGIHHKLWDRIFDFGFTSRKGGAGLGLTISRQIARNLGGNLRVEQSHILWGTTFLLELPKGA